MTDAGVTEISAKMNTLQSVCEAAVRLTSGNLSKLFGSEVVVSTDTLTIIPPTELNKQFSDPEELYTLVAMNIEGDLSGVLLFVLPEDGARHVATLLTSSDVVTQAHSGEFSDIELSALKEVGNIVAGSFLVEVAQQSKLHIQQSIPDIATDMIKAVVDELSAGVAQQSSTSLTMVFHVAIHPLDTKATLAILLDDASAEKLFEALP